MKKMAITLTILVGCAVIPRLAQAVWWDASTWFSPDIRYVEKIVEVPVERIVERPIEKTVVKTVTVDNPSLVAEISALKQQIAVLKSKSTSCPVSPGVTSGISSSNQFQSVIIGITDNDKILREKLNQLDALDNLIDEKLRSYRPGDNINYSSVVSEIGSALRLDGTPVVTTNEISKWVSNYVGGVVDKSIYHHIINKYRNELLLKFDDVKYVDVYKRPDIPTPNDPRTRCYQSGGNASC